MHRLSVRVAVLEHELTELRLTLERQTGSLLDTPAERLSEALLDFMDSRRIATAADALERLSASEADCESLVEELLCAETGFFRFPAAYHDLTEVVLPDTLARRNHETRSLRIWSAGCATGQEPYSIAIALCEALDSRAGGWRLHIVGSDIRPHALQDAERGLYPDAELKPVPASLVQKYFARVGEHYLVKPRIRNLVTFATANLAKSNYLGRFDCIFCMDVLPHFSQAQRVALVQRLHLYLEPGGFLLLGQNEKLPAADPVFKTINGRNHVLFQKPRAAAAQAGG